MTAPDLNEEKLTLAQRIEAARRDHLIAGCYAIDEALGRSVEIAFKGGYSADQVHSLLVAGRAVKDGPRALATPERGG